MKRLIKIQKKTYRSEKHLMIELVMLKCSSKGFVPNEDKAVVLISKGMM